jgi:hypothetical protein
MPAAAMLGEDMPFSDPPIAPVLIPANSTVEFPRELVQVISLFGSKFFQYDSSTKAWVGNPKYAKAVCLVLADGDHANADKLLADVVNAYNIYAGTPRAGIMWVP